MTFVDNYTTSSQQSLLILPLLRIEVLGGLCTNRRLDAVQSIDSKHNNWDEHKEHHEQ